MKAFGQTLSLMEGLIQTMSQLLAFGVGKVAQRSLTQSPIGSACGRTEDLQVAQQVVTRVRFDQHGSDLRLLVAFQKNQGGFQQALARYPVTRLIGAIENAQIRARQVRRSDRFNQLQRGLSVGARQRYQILGCPVRDVLSPLHSLRNLIWKFLEQRQPPNHTPHRMPEAPAQLLERKAKTLFQLQQQPA